MTRGLVWVFGYCLASGVCAEVVIDETEVRSTVPRRPMMTHDHMVTEKTTPIAGKTKRMIPFDARASVSQDGLVFEWLTDGGNGSGRDRFGREGRAFDFQSEALVLVPEEAIPSFENGVTVSVWCRTYYRDPMQRIVTLIDEAGTAVLSLGVDAGRRVKAVIAGQEPRVAMGVQAIADYAWHHVAVTVDSATMTVYVDGVRVGWTTRVGSVRNASRLVLAAGGDEACIYHGLLDDLRVYARGLRPEECRALYKEGGWIPEKPRASLPASAGSTHQAADESVSEAE